MNLLNEANLNKLQSFLATEEAEKLVGFEICGRFDAKEIHQALKLKYLLEDHINAYLVFDDWEGLGKEGRAALDELESILKASKE